MNRTWMYRGEAFIAATTASYRGFTSSAGSWPIWSSNLMSSSPPTTRSWRSVMRARVTATGRTYHSDFAFVFRVRNGKLTAFRAYHDTDAMMRATAV
jgi:hypothetical protein